tara:strand:+ start:354 stop:1589 length:1236 start_codon:yes stop_codon:yes gene_type:complete
MPKKSKKRMYIGITVGLMKENESMWINGIKLNAIFLQNALIKTGHKVVLLDTSANVTTENKSGKIEDSKVIWDSKKFPIYKFQSSELPKIDVLILLGTSLSDGVLQQFKSFGPDKKIVKYMCGNNYVIDMERNIFKTEEDNGAVAWKSTAVDECWYVPQQGYQNHHYYRVLMNLADDKVKPVPFVWDPMFIDEVETLYDRSRSVPVYQAKPNKDKQLCIMEPNMNVVKYSMIPLCIIEDAYNKYDIEYQHTTLISGANIVKKRIYKDTINSLNMVKKLIKTAHRIPVHQILAHFADVIISHQWENPLNYAYLDAMYLQFPLVHNADMIKDAGYYYPDFDVAKGAEQLKLAIENHDDNIEAYNERNEEVMTRYTIYNEDLIKTYSKLLDNCVAGINVHNLSYEYNWKTNTYK